MCSFNEAGAINPGKPIRKDEFKEYMHSPSMRPGRLTPENLLQRGIRIHRHMPFNEAGAINPGKPFGKCGRNPIYRDPFNEAGAINPGKRDRGQ